VRREEPVSNTILPGLPITGTTTLPTSPSVPSRPEGDEGGFGATLKSAINHVNELSDASDQSVSELVQGDRQDIHNVMIAVEKADIAFDLMMQVRNKIVSAYQEVSRMQI
jgi:flagellar hook-basal body complex protein FliE